MTLYETIKRLAYKSKRTVAEVERTAGLSKGTIDKWKKGQPTLFNLRRVAAVLDVTIDDLINENE